MLSGRSFGTTPAWAREDLPEPEGPTIAVQRSPVTIRATASASARRPWKTAASASPNGDSLRNGDGGSASGRRSGQASSRPAVGIR